jgi:hypothetical protein
MDKQIKADLSPYINEQAHIQFPADGVRVMANINGERVRVGSGIIDPETGVFQAHITDDRARNLFDTFVQEHSLSISVSEVECVRRKDKGDLGFSEMSLEQAIQTAIGAASMCWEDLSGAGVFQEDQARNISQQLIKRINEAGPSYG